MIEEEERGGEGRARGKMTLEANVHGECYAVWNIWKIKQNVFSHPFKSLRAETLFARQMLEIAILVESSS